MIPFATVERSSGKAVGSTRFVIDPENRCSEIGWSWLGPQWWRSGINREAKYIMLRHAFDVWHSERVEVKVMTRNPRSHEALRRLRMTEEGVHRKRYMCADGVIRDVTWFSMLDDEWPAARLHIESILRWSP